MQTLQRHPISGTPLEVPDPKMVIVAVTWSLGVFCVTAFRMRMTSRFSLLLVLSALSLFLGSCRVDPEKMGLSLQFDIKEKVLGNGMKVIAIENRNLPIVTYQTWIRAGSVDDPLAKSGIAHLFEHLMFKGTERYGRNAFFEKLETRGAIVNAATGRDHTVFYETFAPALLDEVIEMEADRLRNLKVSQSDLDLEKNVVFEERRLRVENSVEAKANESLWNLAFSMHPYGIPTIGYPPDLLNISAEDLAAFFQKNYQPSNITLVVVGDFDASDLFKKIAKAYEAIPSKPRPMRSIPTEPEQNEERRLVVKDLSSTASVQMAYTIPSAHDVDSYSIDVMSNILFEGSSSRAYRKIVDELQIATSLTGSSYTPMYPGLLTIRANLRPGRTLDEFEKAFQSIIKNIQDTEVSQNEVDRAVKQLTLDLIDGLQTSQGIAQWLGTIDMIFGDVGKFKKMWAKYFDVTPASVKDVANRYLDPNHRSMVIVQPKNWVEGKR